MCERATPAGRRVAAALDRRANGVWRRRSTVAWRQRISLGESWLAPTPQVIWPGT
jgi:hypothetical protein